VIQYFYDYMTRIAQITPVYPPYKGGIGNVAREYAEYLIRTGHEVEVFTPDYGPPHARKDAAIPVHYLKPWLRYGRAAFVPQLYGRLDDFDLVHLHYPFFGGAEAAARYCRRKKTPLVMTYHMDVAGLGIVKTVAGIYRRTMMPFVINRADRILVEEMPFAVDLERFSPGRDPAFAKKHSLPPNEPLLLFVGGLDTEHYFKGVHVLLQALAEIKDLPWRLIVVGDGNLRTTYQNEVKYLGLADRVCFHGSVGNKLLPDYYRNADLFVFPSTDRSEAFGLVALEAQASGVPVVASALPGVRTVVKNGKTGLLAEPGRADDLADKIRQLLDDPARRREMGQRARHRAELKYAPEGTMSRLLKIYQEVLT
jgi:glycosyltransferase involved in cell wall biosynthesis